MDATIRVYSPAEEAGELIDETIHRRTFDILLDEGYHISVLVFDPDGVQRPSKLEVALERAAKLQEGGQDELRI